MFSPRVPESGSDTALDIKRISEADSSPDTFFSKLVVDAGSKRRSTLLRHAVLHAGSGGIAEGMLMGRSKSAIDLSHALPEVETSIRELNAGDPFPNTMVEQYHRAAVMAFIDELQMMGNEDYVNCDRCLEDMKTRLGILWIKRAELTAIRFFSQAKTALSHGTTKLIAGDFSDAKDTTSPENAAAATHDEAPENKKKKKKKKKKKVKFKPADAGAGPGDVEMEDFEKRDPLQMSDDDETGLSSPRTRRALTTPLNSLRSHAPPPSGQHFRRRPSVPDTPDDLGAKRKMPKKLKKNRRRGGSGRSSQVMREAEASKLVMVLHNRNIWVELQHSERHRAAAYAAKAANPPVPAHTMLTGFMPAGTNALRPSGFRANSAVRTSMSGLVSPPALDYRQSSDPQREHSKDVRVIQDLEEARESDIVNAKTKKDAGYATPPPEVRLEVETKKQRRNRGLHVAAGDEDSEPDDDLDDEAEDLKSRGSLRCMAWDNICEWHGCFKLTFAGILFCLQVILVAYTIDLGLRLSEENHVGDVDCTARGSRMILIGILFIAGPAGFFFFTLWECFRAARGDVPKEVKEQLALYYGTAAKEQASEAKSKDLKETLKSKMFQEHGLLPPSSHIPADVIFKSGTLFIRPKRGEGQRLHGGRLLWTAKEERKFYLHIIRAGRIQQAVILVYANGAEIVRDVFSRYVQIPDQFDAEFFAAAFEEYRCMGDSITLLRLHHLDPDKNLRSQYLRKFSMEIYVIVDEREKMRKRSLGFGELMDLQNVAKRARGACKFESIRANTNRVLQKGLQSMRNLTSPRREEATKRQEALCSPLSTSLAGGGAEEADGSGVIIGIRDSLDPCASGAAAEGQICSFASDDDDDEDARRPPVKETDGKKGSLKHPAQTKEESIDFDDDKREESCNRKRKGEKEAASNKEDLARNDFSKESVVAPVHRRRRSKKEIMNRHLWYYRSVILADLEYHDLRSEVLSPAVLHSEMYQNPWLSPGLIKLLEKRLLKIREDYPNADITGIKSNLANGFFWGCWFKYLQATVLFDKDPKANVPSPTVVRIRIPAVWSPCVCFTCLECILHCGGMTCLGEIVVEYWARRTRWYFWVISSLEVFWAFLYGILVFVSTVDAFRHSGFTGSDDFCSKEEAEEMILLLLMYWLLHFVTFGLGCCLYSSDDFKLAFRLCCPVALPYQFYRFSNFIGMIDPEKREEVEYECDVDLNAAKMALTRSRKNSNRYNREDRKELRNVIQKLKSEHKMKRGTGIDRRHIETMFLKV